MLRNILLGRPSSIYHFFDINGNTNARQVAVYMEILLQLHEVFDLFGTVGCDSSSSQAMGITCRIKSLGRLVFIGTACLRCALVAALTVGLGRM